MTQKQDRGFIVPISTSIQCALAPLYRQAPIKVHIVLTMHDEIVLECPDECVEEAMGVGNATASGEAN